MAAFLRTALQSIALLVVCQPSLALAETGFQASVEREGPSPTGISMATSPAQPACWGEYGTYQGAGLPADECAGWFDAPRPRSRRVWSVDYRVRPMLDSYTSYEFGTVPGDPAGPYAPLSKLEFGLDSIWHGFQIGVEKPHWRVHFEWLTPTERHIDGEMADFDWNIDYPRNDPGRLDSLTLSSQRWHDGQMLELGAEFKLTDCLFDLPVEFWPAAGFRFQRFDIRAYGLEYLVPAIGPIRQLDGVDVITFNQQYYLGFFGGQFRTTLSLGRVPIDVRLQADGGPVAGYNVDHHLLREGDRFTMDQTDGGAWHIALMAEAPLTRRFSAGFQADYMAIRTTGTHRLRNVPLDYDLTWDNGVKVKSNQTTLTAFVRYRF